MKWNVLLGTMILGVCLCSQSYGFELLDRMLGVGNGCGCGKGASQKNACGSAQKSGCAQKNGGKSGCGCAQSHGVPGPHGSPSFPLASLGSQAPWG